MTIIQYVVHIKIHYLLMYFMESSSEGSLLPHFLYYVFTVHQATVQ